MLDVLRCEEREVGRGRGQLYGGPYGCVRKGLGEAGRGFRLMKDERELRP